MKNMKTPRSHKKLVLSPSEWLEITKEETIYLSYKKTNEYFKATLLTCKLPNMSSIKCTSFLDADIQTKASTLYGYMVNI